MPFCSLSQKSCSASSEAIFDRFEGEGQHLFSLFFTFFAFLQSHGTKTASFGPYIRQGCFDASK
jgi:hypothetical protein